MRAAGGGGRGVGDAGYFYPYNPNARGSCYNKFLKEDVASHLA